MKKIAYLKDILIHEYFGINLKVLWDIFQNRISELNKQIKKIIKDTGNIK